MEVTLEKLSPCLVEMRVQVPATDVANEVDNAYNALRRTARVRGFRRGKAPRRVLVHVYGPSVHADVVQKLVDRTLQQALNERAVQPLTKPDVVPAELDPKSAFSFKARFEVRPEIEKLVWEGLEARREPVEVSDAQVDEQIERLRQEHATLEPIEEERPAQDGDIATVSLAFVAKGEARKEELDVELGKGQVLPGIEQGIVGMKPGETKDVTTKFPSGHPDAELRDQDITFAITLDELKRRVLPEVDDELAKDCDAEDLASLREELKSRIKRQLDQKSAEEVAKQLVGQLCEKNPIPAPPSLVEQQMRASEQELRSMAQMTGQRLPATPELRERIRADAEMKVRAGLLMAAIATEKGLKVTEEDIERGYHELAAESGKNVAKVKAEYRERGKREMLIGMILEDKVLDLMEGAANITSA